MILVQLRFVRTWILSAAAVGTVAIGGRLLAVSSEPWLVETRTEPPAPPTGAPRNSAAQVPSRDALTPSRLTSPPEPPSMPPELQALLGFEGPTRLARFGAAAKAVSPSPPSNPPQELRPRLTVLAGPPRSEVRLNGRRLGATPYLGEVTCRPGERLRLEVIPRSSSPVVRELTCQGSDLRVE